MRFIAALIALAFCLPATGQVFPPPSTCISNQHSPYTAPALWAAQGCIEKFSYLRVSAKLRWDAKQYPLLAAQLHAAADYIDATKPAEWYVPIPASEPVCPICPVIQPPDPPPPPPPPVDPPVDPKPAPNVTFLRNGITYTFTQSELDKWDPEVRGPKPGTFLWMSIR